MPTGGGATPLVIVTASGETVFVSCAERIRTLAPAVGCAETEATVTASALPVEAPPCASLTTSFTKYLTPGARPVVIVPDVRPMVSRASVVALGTNVSSGETCNWYRRFASAVLSSTAGSQLALICPMAIEDTSTSRPPVGGTLAGSVGNGVGITTGGVTPPFPPASPPPPHPASTTSIAAIKARMKGARTSPLKLVTVAPPN